MQSCDSYGRLLLAGNNNLQHLYYLIKCTSWLKIFSEKWVVPMKMSLKQRTLFNHHSGFAVICSQMPMMFSIFGLCILLGFINPSITVNQH
jgi:hypothetical protein